MNTLTPEQQQALQEFVKKHGRTWKAELRAQWMKAKAPQQLHVLRNTHGPRWLEKVKL